MKTTIQWRLDGWIWLSKIEEGELKIYNKRIRIQSCREHELISYCDRFSTSFN